MAGSVERPNILVYYVLKYVRDILSPIAKSTTFDLHDFMYYKFKWRLFRAELISSVSGYVKLIVKLNRSMGYYYIYII